MQLLQMTDSHMKDHLLTVFWQAFACGFYSAFDYSLDQECADHCSQTKTGNLRAEISISGALITTVHTIRYGQLISSHF